MKIAHTKYHIKKSSYLREKTIKKKASSAKTLNTNTVAKKTWKSVTNIDRYWVPIEKNNKNRDLAQKNEVLVLTSYLA